MGRHEHFCPCSLGMSISITEADAIHILMHCQWSNAYEDTVPVKSLDTPSHFLRSFFFTFIIFYMVDNIFFV